MLLVKDRIARKEPHWLSDWGIWNSKDYKEDSGIVLAEKKGAVLKKASPKVTVGYFDGLLKKFSSFWEFIDSIFKCNVVFDIIKPNHLICKRNQIYSCMTMMGIYLIASIMKGLNVKRFLQKLQWLMREYITQGSAALRFEVLASSRWHSIKQKPSFPKRIQAGNPIAHFKYS